MFAFILILLPILLPMVVSEMHDPAPGITQSKADARNLDCTRMDEATAHQRYPGAVAAPKPRGSYIDTDVVVCENRILPLGERPDRDEAILSHLTQNAASMADAAVAAVDRDSSLANKHWLVEVFYPSLVVAGKISFATKVALVERGRKVSDRAPSLAAGDVMVLGEMQASQAYPAACKRYQAEGSLADDEVLLAVVLRDPRETILHAGLCVGAQWRWLR